MKDNSRKAIITFAIILVFISFVGNYHYLTEYLPHRSEFRTETAVIYESTGGGHGWGYFDSYQVGYGPEGTYAYVNGNFWEHKNSTITVAVPDGSRHSMKNVEGTDEPDTGSPYYRYPVQRASPVVTTGMLTFGIALIGTIVLHWLRPVRK